jgi:cytochrome c oxidase assembly protein subunit 15
MLLYVVQLLAGAVNVVLKAPVWMQLLHLLLSDMLWVVLVLLSAAALATEQAPASAQQPIPSASVVK